MPSQSKTFCSFGKTLWCSALKTVPPTPLSAFKTETFSSFIGGTQTPFLCFNQFLSEKEQGELEGSVLTFKISLQVTKYTVQITLCLNGKVSRKLSGARGDQGAK